MDLNFITLTPQESEKILAAGSGEAALLLLYVRATGDVQLRHAQERLRIPAQNLSWAQSVLQRLGLLEIPKESQQFDPDHAPSYSGEAVVQYAAQDNSFSLLQEEISRRLGRPLTSEELRTLLTIRDYLKLPPEVVSMAVTYCIQKNEYLNRAKGGNRTVTMRMVERECYRWANLGLRTLDQASEYIVKSLQGLAPEGQVKKLLQIDRALVPAERQYIDTWLSWGFEPAAIGSAYEKTVLKKNSLNWSYMNGILTRWHEKGLHTLAQVQTLDQKGPVQQPGTTGGFTPGESELQAVAALKRLRDAKKEG